MICVKVYRVPDHAPSFVIDVPSDHRFLGMARMQERPWLAFLVDTDQAPRATYWRIYRTGDPIPTDSAPCLTYVATIPDSGAGRHLFRYVETPKPIFS
jgi:hypothetical protein